MKVLVVTTHTTWVPHYETDLEIIQLHLDAGDSVTHLYCDGALPACDHNPRHEPDRCRTCRALRADGRRLVAGQLDARPLQLLTLADRQEVGALPQHFASIDQLNQLRVGNFDLGYAVASSIISLRRDPDPDLSALGTMVADMLASALTMYRSLQRHLDQHPTDRVYVFNGRFAPHRAVLRACQSRNVQCLVHERGHDIHHYALFENAMPNDLIALGRQIRVHWAEAAANPKRSEIGAQFFTDCSQGVVRSWYSFTKDQQDGLLPKDWDKNKRNVVIFNSSEDEVASIGDTWKSALYGNQTAALEKILGSFASAPGDLHFYLRVHPNLRNMNTSQVRAIERLKYPQLTVIPADDPISTYALIREADKALTFGSTVGIEAVFWGTPSILAGQAIYKDLGATYNPTSHDELIAMLRDNLSPKDKTPALMYGYFLNSFGLPFQYFRATGLGEGTFKGRRVIPRYSVMQNIAEQFRRLWRLPRAIRRRYPFMKLQARK